MFIVEADINLSAIESNFNLIKKITNNKKILVMLKADAYGHGLLPVANTLLASDGFGVARCHEGITLRKFGIKNKIVVMSGFNSKEELLEACKYDLDFVVHTKEQIEILINNELPCQVNIWLKLDTGMHRLGFYPDEIFYIKNKIENIDYVQKPVHLLSHLARSDEVKSFYNNKQADLFAQIATNWDGDTSIANSGAIFTDFRYQHTDWVRPGIAIYGVSPLLQSNSKTLALKSAMELKTRLIAIKKCKRYDQIGYSGTYICPEDMLIGIAAIGYGDGYPRHARIGTPVLVADKECYLIGRVSMDTICIDLRNFIEAKVGEQVILWGENLQVEKVANCSGTIAYELVTSISARVKRNYIY